MIGSGVSGTVYRIDPTARPVVMPVTQAGVYQFAVSAFGGRLVAAPPANVVSDTIAQPTILVPIATAERFAEIATFCNAPASLTALAEDAWLMTQSEESQGQALLAQLDSLAEGAIPHGCEADLRAIAEAMQMQGER